MANIAVPDLGTAAQHGAATTALKGITLELFRRCLDLRFGHRLLHGLVLFLDS
jgi:hypothetical protein